MNNFIVGVKKFFTNKNTVTVIGVLAAVIILYVAYNARVKAAVNPVQVPYAKETITAGTQITDDMIGIMEVPPAMLTSGVIRNRSDVVDKYAQSDSVIPAGSLFYSRSVVEKEQLAAGAILDYPDGYVLYNFALDMSTSYGNSMVPDNYVDIYLKAMYRDDTDQQTDTSNNENKVMVGKLLENVKILSVKDSSGQPVFANMEEQRTPAMMIFAVPEEYFILLQKAKYLRSYDTTLIPVPTAESLKEEPGEVKISSNDIRDFINKVTIWTDDGTAS